MIDEFKPDRAQKVSIPAHFAFVSKTRTETVEGNVESEPAVSATEENLEVGPLGVMTKEVAARRLGHLDAFHRLVLDLLESPSLDEIGILLSLVQITLDVHGVARGFGDGQAVVQGDARGNDAQADDDAPHVVDVVVVGVLEQDALEARGNADGDDGGGEVTETLHGEDGVHHAAAVLGGGELGGDDGREGVVAANTDAVRVKRLARAGE